VEHKAYLHRSGRTARAGNSGTVVTLMTDAQVRDVRTLTRKAGVKPTVTKLGSGHPLLAEIAPGERTLVTPSPASDRDDSRGRSDGGRRRNGRPRNGRGGESRGSYGRGNNGRGGEGRSSTDPSGGRGRPRRSGPTSERRTNDSRSTTPSRSGGAAGFSSGGSRRRGR